MPVLEDIYIQEMDRATSRLEVTRINPTRKFIKVPLDATGHWIGSPALYWWQNGHWFDTGGNPIEAEQVPVEFRNEIAAVPVTVATLKGPAVTAVCRLCGEHMNSSDMEQHLIDHVNKTLAQAGAIRTTAPVKEAEAERPVTAKNMHART